MSKKLTLNNVRRVADAAFDTFRLFEDGEVETKGEYLTCTVVVKITPRGFVPADGDEDYDATEPI